MSSTCTQCGSRAVTGATTCRQCGGPVADVLATPPPPPGGEQPPGPSQGGGHWAPPPQPGPPSSDSRNLGLLAHLSAFVTFIGIPSFIGPLVVWLWQREQDQFVAAHAVEALNFNLSVLLYTIVGGVAAVVIGLLTLGLGLLVLVPLGLGLAIAYVVVVIVAGLAASRGEGYRYPVTIRFVS